MSMARRVSAPVSLRTTLIAFGLRMSVTSVCAAIRTGFLAAGGALAADGVAGGSAAALATFLGARLTAVLRIGAL
jgi:hypothetical protein